MRPDNIICAKTLRFAVSSALYCRKLRELKDLPLSFQLFRSSTSIGANVREAQNAESIADFIHKFKIAMKEVEETDYRFSLCEELYDHTEISDLRSQLLEIEKIINKIISTSKRKKQIQ